MSRVSEFFDWVASHAPRTSETLRPGVGLSAIEAAESRPGVSFPDDLRELYRCADGQDQASRHAAGALMPFGFLYSLDEGTAVALQLREALGTSPESVAAGPIYDGFPERCIPIGGLDADHVVVDLRPGERSGSVFLWDNLLGNLESYWWPSVDALFAELAATTMNGTPIGMWIPVVEDGILDWDVSEDVDDGHLMTNEVIPESFDTTEPMDPMEFRDMGVMEADREPIYDAKGNVVAWAVSEPQVVGYIDEDGNEVYTEVSDDEAN